MVNEIGPDLPVDAPGFEDGCKQTKWIHAAAPPVHRMQHEAFLFYLGSALIDVCCDMNVISRAFGSARHGKPMRNEIPVFRNEIEDFPRHQTGSSRDDLIPTAHQ